MKMTQFGVAILLLSYALSISAENPSTGFCRVKDADIAVTYYRGCVNGLASGEGVAIGRDEYRGSFLEGYPQGYGVYTWGSSSRWATQKYEGWIGTAVVEYTSSAFSVLWTGFTHGATISQSWLSHTRYPQ